MWKVTSFDEYSDELTSIECQYLSDVTMAVKALLPGAWYVEIRKVD